MKPSKISLDHGSGGTTANNLVKRLFLPAFNNHALNLLDDGAVLDLGSNRLAFSTDSYVVDPIFFPGGSIGDLAINGTVNDVAMCGANVKYLSLGLIIEEGFSITELEKIVYDMSKAASNAGVKIVTGDTKVVSRGSVDKIFINTSGIGIISEGVNLSGSLVKPGDSVILSGSMADHGVAIMIQRQGISFDCNIKSDTTPLNGIVHKIINNIKSVHALRDPTRGGVATSLNEIAYKSQVGIEVFEENLPIKSEVLGICDLLGFDPMYVANEGKFIAFVSSKDTDKVLDIIKNEKGGKDASIVGEVVEDHPGQVIMKTAVGGKRIISMITGEQLPRIC